MYSLVTKSKSWMVWGFIKAPPSKGSPNVGNSVVRIRKQTGYSEPRTASFF